MGPDGILEPVLGAYAEQLVSIFTEIFNLSLAQVIVPAFFKTTSIVPEQLPHCNTHTHCDEMFGPGPTQEVSKQ